MTAKFKPPPLVPSAEERTRAITRCPDVGFIVSAGQCEAAVKRAAHDSAIAMLDAVIALLREPGEDLQYRLDEVFWELWVAAKTNNAELRHTTIAEAGVATGQFMPQLLRALAAELERRKP